MKKRLILLLACLLGATSAQAQTADRFSAAGFTEFGQWHFKAIADPITDKTKAVAATTGEGGTLMVKCDAAGARSVYVAFQPRGFFGKGESVRDRRPVVFRFDQEPAIQIAWHYLDTVALVMEGGASVFTRGLLTAHEKVAVRGTSYRFEELTAVFSLDGAAPAVRAVYEACGDTLPA